MTASYRQRAFFEAQEREAVYRGRLDALQAAGELVPCEAPNPEREPGNLGHSWMSGERPCSRERRHFMPHEAGFFRWNA